MLEFSKMLTISTAHISLDTNMWLIRECNKDLGNVVVYLKNDVGFFIYVPELLEILSSDIPKDLEKCMLLAENNDCTWLCLDRDGEVVENLDKFEWSDKSE